MVKAFRKALSHGTGYRFTFDNRRYEVIDDFIIYHYDSDTTYIKDIDF